MQKVIDEEVLIPTDGSRLPGTLSLVPDSPAVVLFAHGSGSGRFSSRNRFVARELQLSGIGTLLFDLLTAEEEDVERHTKHLRFDIELLAARLIAATWWLEQHHRPNASIGYFGASTGAAAALVAAVRAPDHVEAIVSRGGRPDLAGSELDHVRLPTLLIVGGADRAVLEMNRGALEHLDTEAQLEVVPNATHLFEEPGALEEVAGLARRWFMTHLRFGGGLAHAREQLAEGEEQGTPH